MKWFEGSINEAVTTSKSKKAIFVVFIEGKDDTSVQFAQAINVTEVSTRLEHEDFVAIRLESGSEPYRFFAQIYHLVPVPSLFFIGENGIPLEIVVGNVNATELTSKIESVLTKAGKGTKNSSLTLIESEQKSATCNNTPEASGSDINTVKPPDTDIKADVPTEHLSNTESENKLGENKSYTDVKDTEIPTTSNEPKVANNVAALSIEEKIERAKQLLEVQKKRQQEEEERKEREAELRRRKTGQDVQKMRQKQQDLEVKQAHEERMKEKAEEAAAREKVRQQIAQDKLERKQKELALQQQVQQQQQPVELPKARTPLSIDATVTRIQFRLPSGNPHMGQFPPTSTLRTLRTYVAENINLPFRQFAMSTSFPRRDLTNEDNDKTLLELELVPTAVILILPLKNNNTATTVTSTQDVSFLSRFIWSFFAPVIGIYNYLMGFFSGASHGNSDQHREDSTNSSGGPSTGDGTSFPNFQNMAQSSGLFRRNISSLGGTTTIRAQGNIHRLHSGGDDNDENNTWNGNSTQQM